jgi:TonB family protein
MKRNLVLSLVLGLCIFSGAISQTSDSIEEKNAENQNANVFQELSFVEKYGLENAREIRAKMLDEGQMRSEPVTGSFLLGVRVPKDDFVYVYKYYREEKCWAAKYGEAWGFLDDHLIFPVRDASPETASGYDEPPQLKSRITPKYPEDAKNAGITGKVYIKVFIDKDGKAKETIILQGIPELNDAAIEAVREAKYGAAKLKGKPVGVWVNLSITFE